MNKNSDDFHIFARNVSAVRTGEIFNYNLWEVDRKLFNELK